jgi:hypothetical protein
MAPPHPILQTIPSTSKVILVFDLTAGICSCFTASTCFEELV